MCKRERERHYSHFHSLVANIQTHSMHIVRWNVCACIGVLASDAVRILCAHRSTSHIERIPLDIWLPPHTHTRTPTHAQHRSAFETSTHLNNGHLLCDFQRKQFTLFFGAATNTQNVHLQSKLHWIGVSHCKFVKVFVSISNWNWITFFTVFGYFLHCSFTSINLEFKFNCLLVTIVCVSRIIFSFCFR